VTGTFGNAQLKPERGEELETGFDASILAGRINLEYTHYRKSLTDAILNKTLSPSTGFGGSQIVNVGLVHIWGHEIGANARLLERGWFAWELDTQFSTNKSEIIDMGGVISDINREGYPIASYFGREVLDGTIDANRVVTSATCDGGTGKDGLRKGGAPVPCAGAPLLYQGPSSPVWDIGVGNTITLFNNVKLYARVEGSGGHLQTQDISGGNHRDIFRTDNPIYWTRAMFGSTSRYRAGFLRLREVSVSYELPTVFAEKMGATRGGLSLAFRNVAMLWTREMGWSTPRDGHFTLPYRDIVFWDPENRGAGNNPSTGFGQTVIPTTSSAIMTLRFSF